MNIAKDKLHETLNFYNKLWLEKCSHNIRYADDCPECDRIWDDAYPTISKAAYNGAKEDMLIWKKRALEAEKHLAAINVASNLKLAQQKGKV